MTHTVDHYLYIAWLTDNQQRLESEAIMVVHQDSVHLHCIGFEVELAVLDLHRVDILGCLRTRKRHEEDTFALILFTIHKTLNTANTIIR